MKTDLILCPVDFSSCSQLAIEVTSQLAQKDRSRVVLLHVSSPRKRSEQPQSIVESRTQKMRERLRDQCLTDQSIDVQHVNLRGRPAEVILKYARRTKVDVIVMGTHGRSGLARMMAGSVALEVMREAPCPVIAVKPPVRAEAPAPVKV